MEMFHINTKQRNTLVENDIISSIIPSLIECGVKYPLQNMAPTFDDYVEMFIFADTTSSATFNINQDTTTKARCFWYGYKIIE